MKYILSSLILMFIACTSNPVEHSVTIADYRNSKAPEIDPESHKDKDVEIYRTIMLGDSYATIMYRMDHGQMRDYRGYITTDSNFNKASYTWINDSTIAVKLFDSTGQVQKSFMLMGYGSTTGLDVK